MATTLVRQALSENKVMIFSKSYCPFCVKVKQLFNSLKVQTTVWELDERNDGAEIQNVLKSEYNARTVPQVFIAGQRIGGNDDTQSSHASGELIKKLQAAGVSYSA